MITLLVLVCLFLVGARIINCVRDAKTRDLLLFCWYLLAFLVLLGQLGLVPLPRGLRVG